MNDLREILSRRDTATFQDSARAGNKSDFLEGLSVFNFDRVLPIYLWGSDFFPGVKSYVSEHLTDLWRNIVLVPIYNFIYIKIGDSIRVWIRRHYPHSFFAENVRILINNADQSFVPAITNRLAFMWHLSLIRGGEGEVGLVSRNVRVFLKSSRIYTEPPSGL